MNMHEVPWPGPRPYEETEWRLFRGRANDVDRLAKRIDTHTLTILSGGSGSGKTSLVRAGLVPELRHRRYHRKGSITQWPVLVLRRWGAEEGTTVDEILLGQLSEAIEDIEHWGEVERQSIALEDAAALRSIAGLDRDAQKKHVDATEMLLRIATSRKLTGSDEVGVSGIILIFDQFEELLRPGGEAAETAVGIIRELHRQGSDFIRILLSLRQEFLYTLRPLETIAGGLANRSVVLKPMEEPTLIDVMTTVSRRVGVPIERGAAKELVAWLKQSKNQSPRRGDVLSSKGETVGSTGSPDLLRLQAVLWELFGFAADSNCTLVDGTLLESFLSEKEAEPIDVVNGSLERWIEYAIRKDITVAKPSRRSRREPRAEEWSRLSASRLNEQVRRVAVRLGPNLSSMDYKVPQEENVLFRLALGEDVWRLGMKDAELKKEVAIIDGEPPVLNSKYLGIGDRLNDENRYYLSGVAKEEGWSPADAADELVVCFREALGRLVDGNILLRTIKDLGDQKRVVWELVHDQLGPAFANWGRDQKDTWRDCENTLVVCNGIQPISVREGTLKPGSSEKVYQASHMTWRGCTVEPIGEGKLVLSNVEFRDCFLIGTIFKNCVIRGGGFRRCVMNGVLFVDCSFERDDDSRHVVFEQCDPNSLAIIDSNLDGLEFVDCELQQPTLANSCMKSDVIFTHQSRVSQGYFDLSRESPGLYVRFDEGSRGFLCSGSEETWGYVKMDKAAKRASEPLPDDFWKRGRG